MSDKKREQLERVQRMVQSNFATEIPTEEEIRSQIKVLVQIQDQLDESDADEIFERRVLPVTDWLAASEAV